MSEHKYILYTSAKKPKCPSCGSDHLELRYVTNIPGMPQYRCEKCHEPVRVETVEERMQKAGIPRGALIEWRHGDA